MAGPDATFWKTRFASSNTPWDRGEASPQLRHWLADGSLSPLHGGPLIAVPGCGSGHELPILADAGFDVFGIDYVEAAIELSQRRLNAMAPAGAERRGQVTLAQADVLQWLPATALDTVYEQTCLCALHPDQWQLYAAQLHRWLRPGGSLLLLLMQARRESAAQGIIEGPPYHCDINAMRAIFPTSLWNWPGPPFKRIGHPMGFEELALVLQRR